MRGKTDAQRHRSHLVRMLAKKEELLKLADKLVAEAESYVNIGHAVADEAKPLEDAIAAYRVERTK